MVVFNNFINIQSAGGAIKEEVVTFEYVKKLINRYKVESNTPTYHAPQVTYATEYKEMKEQLLLFSRKLDAVAPRPSSPQSNKKISFSVVAPQRIDSIQSIIKLPVSGFFAGYGGNYFVRQYLFSKMQNLHLTTTLLSVMFLF